MLFPGIISWKDASCFNGAVVFEMGSFIFKVVEGAPHGGASVLMGVGFEKKLQGGRAPPPMSPPLWETLYCKKLLTWVENKAMIFY